MSNWSTQSFALPTRVIDSVLGPSRLKFTVITQIQAGAFYSSCREPATPMLPPAAGWNASSYTLISAVFLAAAIVAKELPNIEYMFPVLPSSTLSIEISTSGS